MISNYLKLLIFHITYYQPLPVLPHLPSLFLLPSPLC
jgi:hypothetical protein